MKKVTKYKIYDLYNIRKLFKDNKIKYIIYK